MPRVLQVVLILPCLVWAVAVDAVDLRGYLAAEHQHFYETAQRPGLSENNVSVALEPEFYHEFPNRDSITFTPFGRWDQRDSKRTRADIRKLYWHRVERDWELRAGIARVFWGVTESVHLVNIVNQIDLVEDPKGETTLGQPMLHFTWIPGFGNVELFALPGFRERPFPGPRGRPGAGILVDNDRAIYASGAGSSRTDFAARWSLRHDIWDVGVAHFHGTSREPRFDPQHVSINRRGEQQFIPIYDVIDQTSLDLQVTTAAWLFKFEGFTRSGQGKRFAAAAGGFEYTFVGIGGTVLDIGIIGEYLYDERNDAVFDDDIALGLRLTFHDFQSTELVAVLLRDRGDGSSTYYVEASRRLGAAFRLELEARGAHNVDRRNPLQAFAGDGYIQLGLSYYF